MRRNPTHFDPFVALYSDSDNYMETNLPSITPWCMSSRKISRSFISICLRVESPPYNILWVQSRERDLPSPHIDGRGKGRFDLQGPQCQTVQSKWPINDNNTDI